MRIHIAAFLILLSCLNVFSKANAQKISLKVKQVELETVFKRIEKQTEYSFAYQVSLLANSQPITIELKNISVPDALERIFMNLPYRYEIIDKTILIKAKPNVKGQTLPATSKPIIIKGKVTDMKDNPLPAVSIRVRGTNIGTVTDQNGYYNISGEPDGILIFSSVGFQTMQIKINNQSEINLTLIENEAQLQETVIKGYYSTTKELNTGNISTVKAEDIARQPVSDPIAALQGRIPGLFVQQSSGNIGRGLKIQLRGQNSMENGNDPLYIVDGVPFNSSSLSIPEVIFSSGQPISPFNNLNPADIESIEILKDADATAIYGSRGANGVILISTKKGRSDNSQFDLNFYSGAGKIARKLDLLNTGEYLAMRNKAFENDAKTPATNDYDVNGAWSKDRYTDWQRVLIGGTSNVTDIQGSFSGGSINTKFRLGGGFRKETTVYPGDFYGRKANVIFNLNHSSKDQKLNLSFTGNFVNGKNDLPLGEIAGNIFLAPNAPSIYNPDGTLNWENSTWTNPFGVLRQSSVEKSNNLLSNFVASYKLLPGLEVKTAIGYNMIDFRQTNLVPYSSFTPTLSAPAARRTHTLLMNRRNSWIIEPQVSYSKKLWKGKLDALIGSSFQEEIGNTLAQRGSNYSSDALIENIAAGTTFAVITNSNRKYRYNAIFGRVGYIINDKYVLNLTARRDGSSRFGPGKQFGDFGAVGAAWIFSKEKFADDLPFLSFGKIRASYGTTGNDQITDYGFLSTYAAYTSSYQGVNSLEPTQHTNPYFGWERVNKLEAAVDLGFLEDRISLNVSWYRNRTGNQLVRYGLPALTGFTSVQANLPAVIENTGLEFFLSSQNINNKQFTWSTSANITFPKNKLVSYPNLEGSSYATKYVVGEPLSIFFRYNFKGIDPSTGLYAFEDVNKDGAITFAADRKGFFVGQKYYGGIQNNLTYKGFELDFFFQFVKQNGFNLIQNNQPGTFNAGRSNQPNYVLDRTLIQPYSQMFTGPVATQNGFFTQSTGYISDASYIRLKNVSISYNVGRHIKHMKMLRIYLQGQNLLTFTNHKGLDPELGSNTIFVSPLRIMTCGVQLTL